jgi:hypothetical protein
MTPEEALQHPFIDDIVPKVMERRGSAQGKSMLPTPSTFNGRKSMAEASGGDRRKRSQTGSSTGVGGMSISSSLSSFAQSQTLTAARPLPEIPNLTSSTSTRTHRLSNSISSIRVTETQNYGSAKSETRSGLGIFTGPRRPTIHSSNGSLSMKSSSRENTSLLGSRM